MKGKKKQEAEKKKKEEEEKKKKEAEAETVYHHPNPFQYHFGNDAVTFGLNFSASPFHFFAWNGMRPHRRYTAEEINQDNITQILFIFAFIIIVSIFF